MLTGKNVSPQRAVEYFVQGYYQEGSSRWYGRGAQKLGLNGEVNDEETFTHIVNGQSPDGSLELRSKILKSSKRRAASDLTFSAPKSVTLFALVGGDERLITAHQTAVEKTLALIEQRYAHTRVMKGGNSQLVNTGNLVVAEFDHIESRELDPHLHTHCLVMNMTELENGKWYSHLNDAIFANKKYLGMMYQSYLATFVQKLGYEIEPRKHGQFEIKGFKEQDLIEFSKRRQQILAAAGPSASWLEKEKAWSFTRSGKQKIDPVELKAKWRSLAAALGITFVQSKKPDPEYQPIPVNHKHLSDAIAHCSERNVAFYTEDLAKFILEQNLATDLSGIESLIEQSPLLRPILKTSGYYTTHAALLREALTIALMKDGQGRVPAITHPETAQNRIEKTSLNAGQRQAVQTAATTTDQFIAWQGVAGAGKTFALKELKEIAQANGYTIQGFAPSSQAAKVLSEELGIQGETVARLLVSEPPQDFETNQIWIVDEAGLLSAKAAEQLLERATLEQARVILVGDTRQLSAVEAGNPFKSLQQAGMKTAHLNESLRQRTPQLKLAVDLIADDRVEDGFARLDENGCIQTVAADEKIDAIVKEYMSASPEQRAKTLVLANTNAERLALTQAIRDQLKVEGSLGHEATITQLQARNFTTLQMSYIHNFEIGDVVMPTRSYKRRGLEKGKLYSVVGKANDRLTLIAPDGRHFEVYPGFDKAIYQPQQIEIAVGDRLRWRKNDPSQGRRNGQEFIVTAIDRQTATIEYDEGGHSETIDLTKAQHLDYALVSTTYSSQGKTADRVLMAADYTIGQQSFYVAVSRAKYELKLYTEDKSKLLELAQQTKAKENPLELIRQQERLHRHELQRERVVSVMTEKPILKTTKPSPVLKPQLTKLEESSEIVTRGKNLDKLDKPFLLDRLGITTPTRCDEGLSNLFRSMRPLPVPKPAHKPKPIIQPTIPTEAFWVPSNTNDIPDRIETQHWHELVEGSAIHPDIAALNFKSLQQDGLEQEHEAWAHLMYSDKLERSNTGRLSGGMLRKYAHIDSGGWWCNAGIDPREFQTIQPGYKPLAKIWGCFKPNAPRENPDKPGKKIKYEHPPKTDLSIFLLDVPDAIASRIYEKAEVKPTQSDRNIGFWYCVWKYNLPITITEGAKKAASLLSQGKAAIGLPGIYAGYRSKDEQGNEVKARLHEELAIFATPERDIKICFDYETRPETKRNIDIAISRTGSLLQRSGVQVSVVTLNGPDKGVDDFIVAHGGLAYEKLNLEARRLRDWREHHKKQQHQLPKPTRKLSLEKDPQPSIQEVTYPVPRTVDYACAYQLHHQEHDLEYQHQELLESASHSPTEEINEYPDQTVDHLFHKQYQQEILEPVNHLTSENIDDPLQQVTNYVSADQLHNHEHNTEQYQQEILSAIKQLSNYDLLLLVEYVTDYFTTTTSRPPQETDKHFIRSEIDRLDHQINKLWSQQEQLEKRIKSMHYNPFQLFSDKSSDANERSQHTLEHIGEAIAHKKQFEQQLQEWEQHAINYQSWLADPQTHKIRNFAQVFTLPEIQQRLTTAKHEQQQAEYQRSFEQSQNYQHRRGFRR